MSETSKQRRSRIDLTYYRRADHLLRRRRWLTLLALVSAVAWFVAAPIWGRGPESRVSLFRHNSLASKGALAKPHAMWDDNCQACHIPFTPVNGSRWTPTFSGGSHAGDAACQTCHAGTAHRSTQLAADVPSCAECHRDHRGRDASLLAMADATCTTCHKDLSRHRDPSAGEMLTAATVTRFSATPSEHPAFTPPRGVPGPDAKRIKFNHALHMAKGLTKEAKGVPFTFASLTEEKDRARYGWTTGHDNDAIQLECDSCHRLDQSEAAAILRTAGASAGPRSPGDAMLAITYENDCRACHPLPFDAKDPQRTVPHGRKPQEIVDLLTKFYESQAVKDDPVLLQRLVRPRPVPGPNVTEKAAQARKAASEKTLTALRRLFGAAVPEEARSNQGLALSRGGCVECHELTPESKPLTDGKAASTLDIKPVVVRSLWYEGARFNHASHRAMECASCHAGATVSTDQTKLILPDAAQCTSCHAPASSQGGKMTGGAGTSCVECHLYHNGDHPAQGIGATARRGTAEMTVDQFLYGGPPHSQ